MARTVDGATDVATIFSVTVHVGGFDACIVVVVVVAVVEVVVVD